MNKNKLIFTFIFSALLCVLITEAAIYLEKHFNRPVEVSLTPVKETVLKSKKSLNTKTLKDTKVVKKTKNRKESNHITKKQTAKISSVSKKIVRKIIVKNKIPKIKILKNKKIIIQAVSINASSVKKTTHKLASQVSKEVNLSNFEIKNKDIVTHHGFQLKHNIKVISFSEIKLPFPIKERKVIAKKDTKVKERASIVEKVSTDNDKKEDPYKLDRHEEEMIAKFQKELHAKKLMNEKKLAKAPKSSKEELVLFDYSDDTNNHKGHKVKPLVSKNVLDSVKRIMASQSKDKVRAKQKTKSKHINSLKDYIDNLDSVKLKISGYSKDKKKNNVVSHRVPTQNSGVASTTDVNSFYQDEPSEYSENDKVSTIILKAVDTYIDSKGTATLTNFEFIPRYDENIRLYDDASGELTIEKKLNGDLSIMSGKLVSREGVTTNIILPMEDGTFEVDIPVLNRDNFSRFLNAESMNVPGGFILIELGDNVDSVDISSHYAGRIFLNSKFVVASRDSDYKYVLYAGVKPGNSLIRYLTFEDKIAEKIIHIRDNEVSFESSQFLKSKFETFEVRESRVLGKIDYELNIDGDQISYFNKKIKAKNIGINSYKIKHPLLALGMRKYYELNHLDHSIFVGRWDKLYVEIPGAEYIDYIFDAFELESLSGRCMVQVNLESSAIDFSINGDSNRGPMNLEIKYLDKDGLFNDEISPLAKKAFIVGEYEGVLNYKVTYEDSSVDIIESVCSESSYLVEQL